MGGRPLSGCCFSCQARPSKHGNSSFQGAPPLSCVSGGNCNGRNGRIECEGWGFLVLNHCNSELASYPLSTYYLSLSHLFIYIFIK